MTTFAEKIIRWQKRDGRHDLPWQNTRDPYRIWVSEIMLQQTQVSAVIDYYARFMQRFPSLQSLAVAPIDEVMPYWAGLGYYARARNLHKAAVRIHDEFNGVFPTRYEDVWALPGIGRSTAAAICAFAYGQPRPILDGNVKRVFARYFGVAGDVRAKAIEDEMWLIAEREKPRKNIETYIQGQMDLGATLCARSTPKCLLCPLKDDCVAHLEGRTDALPERAPKKNIPHRSTKMLVLLHANKVYVERRPPTGIWGGLYSLPEVALDIDVADFIQTKFANFAATSIESLPVIEHGFSHYTLTIQPLKIAIPKLKLLAAESSSIWLSLDDIDTAALPAPIKKILLAL